MLKMFKPSILLIIYLLSTSLTSDMIVATEMNLDYIRVRFVEGTTGAGTIGDPNLYPQ